MCRIYVLISTGLICWLWVLSMWQNSIRHRILSALVCTFFKVVTHWTDSTKCDAYALTILRLCLVRFIWVGGNIVVSTLAPGSNNQTEAANASPPSHLSCRTMWFIISPDSICTVSMSSTALMNAHVQVFPSELFVTISISRDEINPSDSFLFSPWNF